MQEIILKVKYFERGLLKSLKKVASFFLLNPVPFNRQNYQKQKGAGTSDHHYSGYKTVMVKSKLPPPSGCSLEAVEPHP